MGGAGRAGALSSAGLQPRVAESPGPPAHTVRGGPLNGLNSRRSWFSAPVAFAIISSASVAAVRRSRRPAPLPRPGTAPLDPAPQDPAPGFSPASPGQPPRVELERGTRAGPSRTVPVAAGTRCWTVPVAAGTRGLLLLLPGGPGPDSDLLPGLTRICCPGPDSDLLSQACSGADPGRSERARSAGPARGSPGRSLQGLTRRPTGVPAA